MQDRLHRRRARYVRALMRRLAIVLLLASACSKSEPAKHSAGSGAGSTAGPAAGSGSGTAAAPAVDAAPPPPPPPAIDAAEATGSASGSASFEFDELTKEEQVKYMRSKVVPAMKAAFQAFDKKEFGTFNCKTCHGKGALTKEYDMPNPDLPKLDFAALEAGKHAEMARFMKDKVTPAMAELLGEAPRGPKNPDGFGCLDCHVEKD